MLHGGSYGFYCFNVDCGRSWVAPGQVGMIDMHPDAVESRRWAKAHGYDVEDPAGDSWRAEREDVLTRFAEELAKATGDGSAKRQSGAKPPWYEDDSHEGAIFSHLTKWKRGELVDPDSGAHPLVHAAWRMLAIACRESGNVPSSTR